MTKLLAGRSVAETLDSLGFKRFLIELASQISRAKNELDAMDSACGDGDFGSTMTRAFGQAAKTLAQSSSNDVGAILTLAGTSILSSAGGASGPLFSALFRESGSLAKGKREVGLQDLASMLERSNQKIRLMGGAAVGDKTLIDALEPAVSSLKESAHSGVSLDEALHRAADSAKAGCDSTKQMVAKHGRARYLGEQTIGFVDPGAYLVCLAITTLAMSIKRN